MLRAMDLGAAPVALEPRDNDAWTRALADDGPQGDAARRDLRRALVSGLRRALASRGVGEDQCEDFAQEALLRVRERLPTFRGESRFTSWALSIAVRLAFDELRHRRWKDVSFEAVTAAAHAPVAFEPSAEADQERGLLRERVLAALRQAVSEELTDKQRVALAAELSGMPHLDIAREMGTNRNALYKLTHDARRKIKARLTAAGIEAADVLWIFA
jgi:RNA polymerase sigma-70 factor (ECF subfamily)